MQFEESITVKAPVDRVYATYANVAGWPEWDSDVATSQLDGPFAEGTVGSLKPRQGPKSKIKLTEVTLNKSFTVECKLPLCKMLFVHELLPVDQGTKVTNKIIFSGPLSPVFGKFIGKELKHTLPQSLQGLKQHLEQ